MIPLLPEVCARALRCRCRRADQNALAFELRDVVERIGAPVENPHRFGEKASHGMHARRVDVVCEAALHNASLNAGLRIFQALEIIERPLRFANFDVTPSFSISAA